MVEDGVSIYQAQCTGPDNTYGEISYLLSGTTELTGLEQGEEYSCRVSTINDLGAGPWSETISITTDAPSGLPIWLLYEATR